RAAPTSSWPWPTSTPARPPRPGRSRDAAVPGRGLRARPGQGPGGPPPVRSPSPPSRPRPTGLPPAEAAPAARLSPRRPPAPGLSAQELQDGQDAAVVDVGRGQVQLGEDV